MNYTNSLPLLASLMLILWCFVYPYTCFSLIFVAISIGTMTYSIASYRIQNKKCFISCYFQNTSLVSRLLSSGVFLSIIAFFIALFLSLFLFASVTTWDKDIWIIMLIDVLFLVFLYKTLSNIFQTTLKEEIGKHLIKSWSVALNTFILTIFMLFYNYQTLQEPTYIKSTLEETVEEATKKYHSRCEAIDTIVSINIQKDAIVWYSTLYANENIKDKNSKWLLWLFFLINGGIIYYGWSRFFIEFIAFDFEKFTKGKKEDGN